MRGRLPIDLMSRRLLPPEPQRPGRQRSNRTSEWRPPSYGRGPFSVAFYSAPMRNQPVALVHGVGSSFEHGWRATGWVDLLGDAGRPVVPIDLLGHGTADAPHDPEAYAHLDAILEAALPDGEIDAIGFSLGAQLLLRIASRTPERFGRLVVIGVGANMFRADDAGMLASAFEA